MGRSNLIPQGMAMTGVLLLMLAVARSPSRQAVAQGLIQAVPVCNNQCSASGTPGSPTNPCRCGVTCTKVDPDPFPGQTYVCVGCTPATGYVNGVPACICKCVDQFP